MKNVDKLISALYYAKSDNREKMLADLVLTVMYSGNECLTVNAIIDSIRDYFHLDPIRYEVEQCLQSLFEEDKIRKDGVSYHLEDATQFQIHSTLVKSRDSLNKRFDSFKKIVNDIVEKSLSEDEIEKIWVVYNEYLLECFMRFGSIAIKIFLPFKADDLPQSDILLEQIRSALKSPHLFKAFKEIVIEYPNRLSETELRHLNGLASKAEKFYSLGIEKEEYEKITNLQISNLLVFADTNILYSALNLHIHQEKSAITEIIRLAKNKTLDFRIAYFPKTYKELQKAKKPLENLISRTKFSNSQIRAMLSTDHLDTMARDYYEKTLINKNYPHPAENITYASEILIQQGITLYNHRFVKLEEDEIYLNKRIAEYYDYQRYYNNIYEQKNSSLRLTKDDYKIEHDVFLREAMKALREKFSKASLRFICLTTDRSLIHFDQYRLRKENIGLYGVITPIFMMPSVFIKRIRPFIPISTNDYRKAFISSLTAPTFHKEGEDNKERSITIQSSLEQFNLMGIHDEEIIGGIIQRDVFLEEFSKNEQQHTAEDFIKSEIAKEIETLKNRNNSLEKEIEEKEHAIANQREFADKIVEKANSQKTKLEAEKEEIEKEKLSEIEILVDKIKEKEQVEEKLQKLNAEQEKFSREKMLELKNILLLEVNQSIINLENAEKPLLQIIERRQNNFKWKLSLFGIGYVLLEVFLIYKLTWNIMEPYTYIVTSFVGLGSYLFVAISGKSVDPAYYFKKYNLTIAERVYSEFKFEVDYLNSQKLRKTEIETEIRNLEA